MTVALDLKPSVEGELRAQADAAGLPIDLFLSRKLEALALEQNKQPVDRGDVVSKLRAYETELKASGIAHLFLHGSYARGTATQASDVDVIAEFDRGRKLSLLGRVHLEGRISDILGVKADLADQELLLPEVRERAELESILVF